MQKRYFERGQLYDFSSFKSLFYGMTYPGVYRKFGLTVNSTGNVVIGVDHTADYPGAIALPCGLIATEDAPVQLEFSPPGSPQNYTVTANYTPDEWLMGNHVSYKIDTGLLTDHPTNGTILGWIRYTSGSLADHMITSIFKQVPTLFAQELAKAAPIKWLPPYPVFGTGNLATGAAFTNGWDSSDKIAWTGVENAVTGGTLVSTGRLSWQIKTRPWEVTAYVSIPIGGKLYVRAYDTAGSLAASKEILTTIGFSSETLSIPQDSGTWTTDSWAWLEFEYQTPQGTSVKMAEVTISNWPYEIARIA